MQSFDQVTGTPLSGASPVEPRQRRQHAIAGLALVCMTAAPVVAWSSNGSTGEDSPNHTPIVNQAGITGLHGNEQPVAAVSLPPEEKDGPAEVETSPASSGNYDLALGKSVFNHACLTCHGNSVLDAPRVGDMHTWQPRLAQGLDVLIQHALKGHGRMPAKGGYNTLTDHEVSSAVAYVYQRGTEILARQDNPVTHEGCDPVTNLDQCSPAELKKLLVLQMLWLLGGPHQ
jgi:cytochrome c5